ncbi:hypothetical protein Tco_1540323 [Tanacetum coccineum]
MDRNHLKKQQFIHVKLKTVRGVSTSTNTPISNVFEVLGDLEDDGHLDALDIEDCGKLEGEQRNNKKAHRKTGIRLGKNVDSSSESGFTYPNHFDLLTKKDGKTILLNLQASDDDADVENGFDDTTTLSRVYGISKVMFDILLFGEMVYFEIGWYMNTLKGSGVGTGSTQMLQGVEFEVEPQKDHGFKVEPLGSGDLGVIALIQKDAHESLTFMNAVALEVISKWMVVMKEDMDTRLDLCMLNNGFRQSSDNNNIYY